MTEVLLAGGAGEAGEAVEAVEAVLAVAESLLVATSTFLL